MLKKITILSVLLLTSCLIFGSVSYAEVSVGWADCTVTETYATGSEVWINLTADNGAFTNTWVVLNDTLSNHGLATVFTAMAMEKKVKVKIEWGGERYKIITIGIIN